MFLLFTNDLSCYLSDECKIVAYADDTQLLHSGAPNVTGLAHLKAGIENDLAIVSKWFKSNGLKLNPNKTEFITFGTPHQTKQANNMEVTFENTSLKSADTVKILGITLDKHLTGEQQTSITTKRCFGALISINKLAHTLPRKTTKTLIEALVYPHMRYCLPAWAPVTSQNHQRLNKAVNFGVRIVTGKNKYDRISAARRELGWPTFGDLVSISDSSAIHKLVHEPDGPQKNKTLIKRRYEVSSRTTRASSDSTVIQTANARPPNLENTKKRFPYRAVGTWNALPDTARHTKNRHSFNKRIMTILRS